AVPRAPAAASGDPEALAAEGARIEARLPVVHHRLRTRRILPRLSGRVLFDRREVRRLVAGRGAVRRDAEYGVSVDCGALRRLLPRTLGRVHVPRVFDTTVRESLSLETVRDRRRRLYLGLRPRDLSQSAVLHPGIGSR